MDPSIHALRSFLAVSRTRHFAQAAAQLRMSASAMSEQISGLERQVGAPLFARNSRRVDLTPIGTAMVPYAEQVVSAHDQLRSWASSVDDGTSGDLRIGFLAGGCSVVLTPALETAVNRMPEWRLRLHRLGFNDAVPALKQGEIDVALTPGPLDPAEAGLRGSELFREPRVLVTSSRHRLAGRSAVRLEDLRDEMIITATAGRDAGSRWWAVDPRPDGSSPRYGPEARDMDEALQLAAAGLGVNIAAASARSYANMPGISVVPIEDVEPAVIWILTRADETSPGVAMFERIAHERAAALHAV